MTPSAFFCSGGSWCPRLFFIKCRVDCVKVFRIQMVLNISKRFTNLTKSKRCPKTLDTQGFLSILHFHRFFRFLPFFGAKTFDVDSIAQKYEKSNSSFRPTKHIGKMLNKVTNKFFNSFLFYGIISSINKNLNGSNGNAKYCKY